MIYIDLSKLTSKSAYFDRITIRLRHARGKVKLLKSDSLFIYSFLALKSLIEGVSS